jgi:hypothetical protein
MSNTTKTYSAPKLVMTGTVVARTLGDPIGLVLENAPTDPMPYFPQGI